jgi:hypothetical protein
MAWPRRLILGLATIVLLCLPATAAASGDVAATTFGTPAEVAAQKLAEKYAPTTMLREQRDPPCEKSAEQYQPTSVGTVLGNPTVTLTHDVPGQAWRRSRKGQRRRTSPASPTATTSTSKGRR